MLLLVAAVVAIVFISLYFGLYIARLQSPPTTNYTAPTGSDGSAQLTNYTVSGNYSLHGSGDMLGSHYAIRIVMNNTGFIEDNFTSHNGVSQSIL